MLRINISRDGNGAVKYFNEALSKEDYFFEEREISGQWHGKAAVRMGMSGQITKEEFIRTVHNQHPGSGEKLTVRNAAKRRAGYEYTWNAPKSASLLYALTKDQAILEAHRHAVEKAMLEIETDMQTQAGQGKDKKYETTGNIAYASFEHFTARPVKEKKGDSERFVPDPHLHTHCFVFNCTWNEKKGRFQAIEEGNIRRLAPYYEALYHSHFSRALRNAGYEIVRTHERWEVKGVDRETLDKFSNRKIEIENLAMQKGIVDLKEKSKLGARTRQKKNKSVKDNRLQSIWEERLTEKEKDAIKNAKGVGEKEKEGGEKVLPIKKAVTLALSHFMERKSAVPKKRVLGYAMALGYGQVSPKEVKSELAARGDVIYAEKNTVEYLTTLASVKAEDRMIAFASSTKGRVPALNPDHEIEQHFLNEGQRDAIKHVLTSNDRVVIVSGSAGVGKTSLLTEVKKGIERKGKKMLAFAPSAEASRGTLTKKGFKESDTIAALLNSSKKQQEVQDNVILIDEAGMVGVQTMNKVFGIAQKNNARIILSGDYKQHSSVEAGDALRILEEKSGLRVARVNEIVRQKGNEDYRKAIKELSEGNTLKGYEQLDKMNSVIEIGDMEARQDRIASDYIRSIESRRSAIVVSPTHFEGKALTDAIREGLREKGHIGKEERFFVTQRNLSLTEAQKQDAVLYEPGMTIQFHKHAKGFRAAQKYEVTEKDKKGSIWVKSIRQDKVQELPLQNYGSFQVYRKDETKLSMGDLIRITNNGNTLEGTRVNNGQVFNVKGFTEEGHIQLSNGKTLNKDYRNFSHGYVLTSHASQGKDAQDIFIAQSSVSFAASNEKQFYVSSSRGQERAFIYTDDKEALKEAISRSADRMTAGEVEKQSRIRAVKENRLRFYNQQLKNKFKDGREISKQTKEKLPEQGRDISR